jgi:hypothetical protein
MRRVFQQPASSTAQRLNAASQYHLAFDLFVKVHRMNRIREQSSSETPPAGNEEVGPRGCPRPEAVEDWRSPHVGARAQ